jgi:hypothetical protein
MSIGSTGVGAAADAAAGSTASKTKRSVLRPIRLSSLNGPKLPFFGR